MSVPSLVERYLERALPAGSAPARRIRIEQTGEMRLKPGGRWLRFTASETFETEHVAFAWSARFQLNRLAALRVEDGYADGRGGLSARLWGVLPVMRAHGAEVGRGEAMRYLAELMWVPHAIRGNAELAWREIDAATAEVATGTGAARAAVLLHFDAHGDIVRTSSPDRPYTVGKATTPRPWGGAVGDFAELGGVRIPTRAEVGWTLPEGEFTYWRARRSRR